MADLVVSDEGERLLLGRALGKIVYDPDQPDKLGLFVNDYTPNKDTTLSDLEEPTYPAYERQELAGGDWRPPVTVDGEAVCWYGAGPVSFPVDTGLVIVYGYFVVDYTGAVLLWSQRFDSPQYGNSSFPVQVNGLLTARSQSEPDPP